MTLKHTGNDKFQRDANLSPLKQSNMVSPEREKKLATRWPSMPAAFISLCSGTPIAQRRRLSRL